ncbi:MAG TPA: hypothetical protein VF372_06375 [Thermodesulfobacteriota bacterium]
MNAKDPEKLFLEKVQGLLNHGTENLGSKTERRLQDIRGQALMDAGEKRSRFLHPRRWVLVGSFAMVTLAAVGLFFWLGPSTETLPAGEIEDLEIIASQERIDFYQNLDFYRWLGSKEIRKRPNGKGL